MIKRTKTVLLGLAACLGVCACLSGCVLVERQTEGSVSETVAGEQAFQSDYWYLNRYEAAVGCLERGELMEAYELFLSISDYRDVSDYLRGFSWRPSVKVFANQGTSNTVTYEYDAYGRVLVELYASSDGDLFRTVYTYNECGSVIKIVGTDLQGRVEEQVYSYHYNANGTLLREENPNGDVIETTYDENRNPIFRKSWNKVKNEVYSLEQMEYDGMGRLTKEICESVSSLEIYTKTYAYDAVGNLIKKTRESNRYSGKTVSFYEYDKKGNLISEQIFNASGSEYICVWTYSEDGKLQGSSWRDSASGTSGGSLMEYDERGDLIRESYKGSHSVSVTEYVYDDSHRVIQERKGDQVTEYAYDENGNLTETVVTEGEASVLRYRQISEGYQLYYDPIRAHEVLLSFAYGGK